MARNYYMYQALVVGGDLFMLRFLRVGRTMDYVRLAPVLVKQPHGEDLLGAEFKVNRDDLERLQIFSTQMQAYKVIRSELTEKRQRLDREFKGTISAIQAVDLAIYKGMKYEHGKKEYGKPSKD